MSPVISSEVLLQRDLQTGGFRFRPVSDALLPSAVTEWKLLRHMTCVMTNYHPISSNY